MAETSSPKPKVAIVFYSMYGHVKTMAEKVKEGVDQAGCEGILYQIPETLPQEVLDKMYAPPKDESQLRRLQTTLSQSHAIAPSNMRFVGGRTFSERCGILVSVGLQLSAPGPHTITTPKHIATMAETSSPKPKVAIVFYSMYGHVKRMAEKVKEGVDQAGCEGILYQIPETLPQEVLDKMYAPPKDESIPVATTADLENADGILFGIPTRFGMAAAQVKAFMDTTGGLWAGGKLVGKPAGIFFSTGTQAGGQETTALTFLTQLTHHGMIFVPIGYSSPLLFNMDEIHGGSPYGAGTFAGPDGSRQPSELELGVAEHQGKHFSGVVKALKAGRAAAETA